MPFSFFCFSRNYIALWNGEPYSDGGILNHFPTDILQGQCDNIIGVYVSPIQKNKDLNSIRSVTTRAFDILSANTIRKNLISANGSSNLKKLYSTLRWTKQKWILFFKIGYKQEPPLKNLIYKN
jgi:NTE family protein